MRSEAMNSKWHRAVLALHMCCLLFVAAPRCEAQNLAVNPSFEIIDTCPQYPDVGGYIQGARPTGWFPVNDTPEYFNACEPYGTICSVPVNLGGWQLPQDGGAYSGMLSYYQGGSLWHEMIASELIIPLTVGQTYYVSLYANAAAGGSEWPMLASSHFGALFTMDASEYFNGMPSYPLRNFAHAYSTSVVNDTADWVLISGSFVADSAYNYIVIGNHFDNAHAEADTIITQDSLAFLYRAYTYVDQVCVSTDPMGCPLVEAVSEQTELDFLLYPNPAVDAISVVGARAGEQLAVLDALGRLVWKGVATSNQIVVDTHSWSRGCYTMKAVGKQSRRSVKFVLVV